jgi:FkbM family methyltransferase
MPWLNWRSILSWPKEAVYRASAVVEGLRRIGGSPLGKELKSRIRRSYFVTVVRRRHNSVTRTADVVGYKTVFCNFESLLYLFEEIFLDHQYHFHSARPTPYIVDCGSNIGMSILYFKMLYPSCEILAFEPDERAFACLEANVRNNGLSSVQLQRAALSSADGQTVLFTAPDDPGSLVASTLKSDRKRQEQVVWGTRLSEHIKREVDFLKLDVDGSETVVLHELAKSGKLPCIREMVIEFHHHLTPHKDALSELLGLLEGERFGYQVRTWPKQSFTPRKYQDVLIHAYRNGSVVFET